ncbi:pyridoxal phosphate-dependent transferase [Achaetomium macrosporum]|uniref:Pyridoxal phosphate-dependent transferase n=1 Tax=Achaetomium macrosporum TaxID=79813 RepID=A0AAN7C0F8_9PEZI|nr:pyridoxal phosphate-dependent transferase [Achaetomium macrosporum]
MSQKGNRLDATLANVLCRRSSCNQLRSLATVPSNAVDLASNVYLYLSAQPTVQRAFLAGLHAAAASREPQCSLLGSGGSRLLDGKLAACRAAGGYHRRLRPAAGGCGLYNELIHASVHDGIRLSRARWTVLFRHSCPEGVLFQSGERNVFVAVEGLLYSINSDLPPLYEIIDYIERKPPQRKGYIVVDEAHSMGIFGDPGCGLARVLGFGKAIGCAGGIILCSPTAHTYLINYTRTLIYTTAIGLPSLATIEATYDCLITSQEEPLLQYLHFLIYEIYKLFLTLYNSQNRSPKLFRVSTEEPRSPIIPKWYIVRPIVAPTVPKGSERLRVCLHAGNSIAEVEALVKAVEAWLVAGKAGIGGGRRSGRGRC